MSNQLDLAQAFTKNFGCDVLLFDYCGFGTSDVVKMDTDNIAIPQFVEDIEATIKYVGSKVQTDPKKIVLYGRSMGASLSITAVSQIEGVGAVIAESPYVTQKALKVYYDSLHRANSSSRRTHVIESPILEPLTEISNLHCPFFLLHGELEPQITSDSVCELFAKCNSKAKQLWIVANADHMQIPYTQGGAYLSSIYYFLNAL